jgi:hypothetical protein
MFMVSTPVSVDHPTCSDGAGVLEDHSVVPVIDKLEIGLRAVRNYPERWQFAFAVSKRVLPSPPSTL